MSFNNLQKFSCNNMEKQVVANRQHAVQTNQFPSHPSSFFAPPPPPSFTFPVVPAPQQHIKSVAGSNSSRNPLEIFVGNLSYFCEKKHLYDLFNQYCTVTNVRIMRSEDKSRSLMFGFVTLSNRPEVEEICRLMNDHLFQGRHLRYEIIYDL